MALVAFTLLRLHAQEYPIPAVPHHRRARGRGRPPTLPVRLFASMRKEHPTPACGGKPPGAGTIMASSGDAGEAHGPTSCCSAAVRCGSFHDVQGPALPSARDLAPISTVNGVPAILLINSQTPRRTSDEFIAIASQSRKLNMARLQRHVTMLQIEASSASRGRNWRNILFRPGHLRPGPAAQRRAARDRVARRHQGMTTTASFAGAVFRSSVEIFPDVPA